MKKDFVWIIFKITDFISKRLSVFTPLLLIASVLAIIPNLHIYLDIVSQFKFQYFILGIVFLIYYIYIYSYKKDKDYVLPIFLCTFVILINAVDVCPMFFKYPKIEQSFSKTIKIADYNVRSENRHYDKFLQQIQDEQPDIVLAQEINEDWLENISQLKKTYPYCIEHPRDDNFGIAMYSKIPLKELKIIEWSDWAIPLISAYVDLGNKDIRIIGVHTTPPINFEYIERRNIMLNKINESVKNESKDIIIMGDLNTTSYSYAYKKFIKNTGLKDASRGHQITGTWPDKFFPILRISIDHILSTESIFVKSYKAVTGIGSDHLPVYAELLIK